MHIFVCFFLLLIIRLEFISQCKCIAMRNETLHYCNCYPLPIHNRIKESARCCFPPHSMQSTHTATDEDSNSSVAKRELFALSTKCKSIINSSVSIWIAWQKKKREEKKNKTNDLRNMRTQNTQPNKYANYKWRTHKSMNRTNAHSRHACNFRFALNWFCFFVPVIFFFVIIFISINLNSYRQQNHRKKKENIFFYLKLVAHIELLASI